MDREPDVIRRNGLLAVFYESGALATHFIPASLPPHCYDLAATTIYLPLYVVWRGCAEGYPKKAY